MERKKRVNTKKRSAKNPIIIKISLLIIVFFVLFATIFKITELILINKKDSFPKLEISLEDVTIEQINMDLNSIKYPNNTITLTTKNTSATYDNVEIKGHGNANWNQIKKPYQLKFTDKVSLLDLNASKKWVLITNFLDRSYLRTDIAYYLERIFNKDYALNGNFAELYFDNVYYGLYYISEKVEIDKSRIFLQNSDGIIGELDNLHTSEDECFYDNKKNCIITHDAVNQDNANSATKNLAEKLSELNLAINKKDFTKISGLIDVDSFVEYYLLSEFTNNPDAYSSSLFFYQDGKNDKIHTGPGWDFDFAFANLLWHTDGIKRNSFFLPSVDTALKDYVSLYGQDLSNHHASSISTLFYDLMDIPEFEARVKEIYQSTLSGKKEELLNYIRSQANYIRDAAHRDQERWKLKTNFDDEVDYLIDWVSKRYDHFEQTYGVNSKPLDKKPTEELPNVEYTEPIDLAEPSAESNPNPTPESLPPSTE
ncbi:MAG: CotH kinase family protein [Candidatus Saccharibacteria bacterium]|nr:CotH kinase family protein [Candidatus Saccharibacteria bacterium]